MKCNLTKFVKYQLRLGKLHFIKGKESLMVLIVFREIWNGPNAVNRWRDGNPCLVKCDIYEMHVKSSWM